MKRGKLIIAFIAVLMAFDNTFANAYKNVFETSELGINDTSTFAGSEEKNTYSKLFAELSLCSSGRQVGLGVIAAYVPGKLGGYSSARIIAYGTIALSLGAAYRPIESKKIDFQLLAGPALRFGDKGTHVGPEVGVRFSPSATDNGGWFGWWSLSASYAFFGEKLSVFTAGFSINIASLISLWYIPLVLNATDED